MGWIHHGTSKDSHAIQPLILLQPSTGMIFVNPLLNMSEAAAQMQELKAFATKTLGATFSLSLQPDFLSFFNEFLLDTGVVSLTVWPLGKPSV